MENKSEETANMLYKSRKKEIKCSPGTSVNMRGPAGIQSAFRPESATLPAQYSTIGLILDKILVEKSVVTKWAKQTGYAKFTHNGKTYESYYDGNVISWRDESPNGYLLFIPVLVYLVSDADKRGIEEDEAAEIKAAFEKCCDEFHKNGIVSNESLLLLCDSVYYCYATIHPRIVYEPKGMAYELFTKALASGTFMDLDCLSDESVSTETKETKSNNFKVNYDWDDESKLHIPGSNALKGFVMTNETESIAKKVKFRLDKVLERLENGKTGNDAIENDYVNLLMVGRPSTGKTTIAGAVAAMTGLPIYTIPFSKNTEEDVAEGKNKVVDGKIQFVETDFLRAYEHGGIIVCEEINLADPAVVMGSLGQAIEKPFVLMKDGYIPVHRHPLCVIIGTMNTGTAGSKNLNEALSSRFKATFVLDDPDKQTFINILSAAGHTKSDSRKVYDAYKKITEYLKDPHQSMEILCDNITLRGCLGALECMEEGMTLKEAIKNTLVGKIAERDLEAAREVEEVVVSTLPD